MQKNDNQKRGELEELFVNRLIYLLDADRLTVAQNHGKGAWWMLTSRTDM
jgi:hypothetical protein